MQSRKEGLSDYELSPYAEVLARKFIQRWDMYPKQLANGRWITVHEPLHTGLLLDHLRGRVTLGAYLLNKESYGRFLVLDADDDANWEQLRTMAYHLLVEDTTCYLESSRRGGHLWLFFDGFLTGRDIKLFGKGLLTKHKIDSATVEVFPKQVQLGDGPGSSIRLPFGLHRKSGQRYPFHLPTGKFLAPTMREQLHLLGDAETVPNVVFDSYLNYGTNVAAKHRKRPQSKRDSDTKIFIDGGSPADQLKKMIDIREFIEQYVELSPSGVGRCPFHDDHNPSFSVNAEEGYWHCFACGIGGSVLDFYMQYHDCDFKTCVRELKTNLLSFT